MKTIEFNIPRSEVEELVDQTAAYTGARSEGADGERFDRVATADTDSPFVGRFLSEAFNTMTERLKEFVTAADCSGDALRMSLELSDSWDPSMAAAARAALVSYLAAFVTFRWMCLTMPGKAAEWESETIRHAVALERNLFHRRPPVRIVQPTITDNQ